MSKNHELLRKLGASADKVDSLIRYLLKKKDVLGAKLTGGGGGGSIIVLAEEYREIINDLSKKGFECHLVGLGEEGVREEI